VLGAEPLKVFEHLAEDGIPLTLLLGHLVPGAAQRIL
jgi:hypothetical protein